MCSSVYSGSSQLILCILHNLMLWNFQKFKKTCSFDHCKWKLHVPEVATDIFFLYCDVQLSKTDYRKRKKCMVGTWFNPSVVDWMEEDVNVSLQSIVRKEQVSSFKFYLSHTRLYRDCITSSEMRVGSAPWTVQILKKQHKGSKHKIRWMKNKI